MMDELDLATRLRQAAADPPVELDLHAVVAAGRRRRRARAAAASGVLALAVAAGVAAPVLLDRDGPSDRVTVAGPGPSEPGSSAPEPPMDTLTGLDLSVASPAQAAEIADRVASPAEYRAAYGRYRACMLAGGYELEAMPPVLAVGGRHTFAVPDEAVQSGVDGECYDREYKFVDILWQTALPVDPDEARTTDERFRECLRERGIEPREAPADVDKQVRAAGIDIGDCLLS